jgi:hypothetical protein
MKRKFLFRMLFWVRPAAAYAVKFHLAGIRVTVLEGSVINAEQEM